jgi:hypothetical protein
MSRSADRKQTHDQPSTTTATAAPEPMAIPRRTIEHRCPKFGHVTGHHDMVVCRPADRVEMESADPSVRRWRWTDFGEWMVGESPIRSRPTRELLDGITTLSEETKRFVLAEMA